MSRVLRRYSVRPARRVLPAMACLAALALTGCAGAVIPATGHSAATHARRPAARPSAARQPAVSAVPAAARCRLAYLRSSLHLAGVRIDSAAVNASGTFTQPYQQPLTGLPSFCDVVITRTDSAGNPIHIDLWLPRTWNGRFEGVGGAVYACGPFYYEMAPAIQAGYAVAATDCGVPPADLETATWALNGGRLNWPLIDDFAYAGIHDMTVAGKAATSAYYRSSPRFSYFSGCSTGGREGLVEAQRYPADYNGIAAGAPAINWTQFIPAEIWPQLVMNESHDFLPACKQIAFTDAAVRACRSAGGVIANPSACRWNPYSLAGLATPCGVITRRDAAVMAKIWRGPLDSRGRPLWYGLERGASLSGLAATTTINGVTVGEPFPVTVNWLGRFLLRDPSWNWQTLTYAQFRQLFQRSGSEFAAVFAANNPDLSGFRAHGGKIIIWHGLADQLIFPQGTIRYYGQVQQRMGGLTSTETFARLFLAPGAQHCASGTGSAPAGPSQPLASLVKWVEKGTAPVTIPGSVLNPATGAVTGSRPLCLYPLVARYRGSGSTSAASSYACTT